MTGNYSVAARTLVTGSISIERCPPVNLKNEDARLFAHEFRKTISNINIVTLDNVRFFKDRSFYHLSSCPLPHELENQLGKPLSLVIYHLSMAKAKLLGRLKYFESPVLFVTDTWSMGYFHWLSEVLLKLIVLKCHGFKEAIVMLPNDARQLHYAGESVKSLGFLPQYAEPGRLYAFRTLVTITPFTTPGNFSPEWMCRLRDAVRLPKKAHRRAYISRARASKRKIQNEISLLPVLAKFGFVYYETDSLSFEEQANLFSSCELIVSVHGAGLTNMIFMPAGSSVLEFRKSGDAENNCYFSLANALGHSYFYLECVPVQDDKTSNVSDLRVNINDFEQLLAGQVKFKIKHSA